MALTSEDGTEKTVDELHEEIYGKQTDLAPDSYGGDDEDGTPPSAPPAVVPLVDEIEDYQHKYSVLQGKYNTEIQRQNEILTQTFAEKAKLEAEIARLKPVPGTRPDGFVDEIVSPEEDIEFFQKEYPNIFKGAMALLQKELSKVEQKVAAVGNVAARAENENYKEAMDAEVKDWQVINKDPKFLAWLQVPAQYTNIPKHKLLLDSFNNRDAASTAQFFKDFLAESGDPSSTSTKVAPAANRDISPSTSGNPAPSPVPKGEITRTDIARFYKDRAEGRYVGTEDDAAKTESRFLKAIREGKVR